MVKASAQSPELVQIFEVALSRRICCSRVERVRTKPRRPSASTVSPQSRPGAWRRYFSRVANRPTYGPPKFRPLPIDWPSAATISAPISPGDFSRPRDTTSVTITISRAPAAWAGVGDLRDVRGRAEHIGGLHHHAGDVRADVADHVRLGVDGQRHALNVHADRVGQGLDGFGVVGDAGPATAPPCCAG